MIAILSSLAIEYPDEPLYKIKPGSMTLKVFKELCNEKKTE